MMLSERFAQALAYAHQLHQSQVRKGTAIPYLSHLLAVSALVLENGGDEDQAIAALLHDSLEDGPRYSPYTRDQITADIATRFGERVLRIVEGCTDREHQETRDWRTRKEHYLQHLEQVDADVLLVANADKLHNAQAIWRDYQQRGEQLWERFSGGKTGTLWYYQRLAELFHRRRPGWLAQQLQTVVQALVEAALAERTSAPPVNQPSAGDKR
ncbi:MAG: HD domain-containing protein [Gloeomargarita sp. GMQP_bins_120]